MAKMPTWEGFLTPTLRVLADGELRHRRDIYLLVADVAALDDEQRAQTVASGTKLMYKDRVGWSLSFLTNVGALRRPLRGSYQITDAGKELVVRFPKGVTEREIKALGEDASSPIRVYQSSGPRAKVGGAPLAEDDASTTPIEQVETGIRRIHEEVRAELLERLQGKAPEFFESAVVRLLGAMGYGGADGSGRVTQRSNDGGIDGVIDQDVLGLRRVYIQAKRYKDGNTVGRPDLQNFVGALTGTTGRADGGVFITTSRFSDGAKKYAESVNLQIILIDGARLTKLMIQFGVGVQVRETYKVVEIDEDFFE